MWHHFDSAFKRADEAFAEADKAFDAMRDENISSATSTRLDGVHTLRFEASNWHGRRKLCWKLVKMSWAALWSGKTTLTFKSK